MGDVKTIPRGGDGVGGFVSGWVEVKLVCVTSFLAGQLGMLLVICVPLALKRKHLLS